MEKGHQQQINILRNEHYQKWHQTRKKCLQKTNKHWPSPPFNFDSHVDQRYKSGLIKTMVNRTYRLYSSWKSIIVESETLKSTFSHLQYPTKLIDSTVSKFITSQTSNNTHSDAIELHSDPPPNVSLFIDQTAAENTRRQLRSLSNKIGLSIQPVFIRRKIGSVLKTKETKPKIVNQQCVVYRFKCGLCDMDYEWG